MMGDINWYNYTDRKMMRDINWGVMSNFVNRDQFNVPKFNILFGGSYFLSPHGVEAVINAQIRLNVRRTNDFLRLRYHFYMVIHRGENDHIREIGADVRQKYTYCISVSKGRVNNANTEKRHWGPNGWCSFSYNCKRCSNCGHCNRYLLTDCPCHLTDLYTNMLCNFQIRCERLYNDYKIKLSEEMGECRVCYEDNTIVIYNSEMRAKVCRQCTTEFENMSNASSTSEDDPHH